MRRYNPALAVPAICLALALWPTVVPAQTGKLGERIAAYALARPCPEPQCRNPIVVVEDLRIKVVRFDGGYREESMKPADLAGYLDRIPLSAWQNGAKVWVNRADFHALHPGESGDEAKRSQQIQFASVLEILKQLALIPTNKEGIPY
jgi:hypothetical protein